MVKGILADIHLQGPVAHLARVMQGPSWVEFWNHFELALFAFEDVGLTATSTDKEIWHKSGAYAGRVLERLYECLLDMEKLLGTGRVFLP